jgi:hypothetical protein
LVDGLGEDYEESLRGWDLEEFRGIKRIEEVKNEGYSVVGCYYMVLCGYKFIGDGRRR